MTEVPPRESMVQQLSTLEGVVIDLAADCVDDLLAADAAVRAGNLQQAEVSLERARFATSKIVELPNRFAESIRQRIQQARKSQ